MANPTITWHYWDGDSWVDITTYVLADTCSGSWGMRSNRYTDRLAGPGEMRFTVKNKTGEFDPDSANALTGWKKNTKIIWTVTFDGVSWRRFYGAVNDIQFSDPSTYAHTATVLVTDWMEYAYKRTINQQSIETNRRGDQVVNTIVDAVGQTPLATSYDIGYYEFPAAFDSMTTKTKAATELNKIVLSEGGYFYNRHDKVNGETLVFESASYRNDNRTLSKLPVLAESSGYLLKAGSTTDLILMAGSTTDRIVLNQATDANLNGLATEYKRTHGDNILNKITVTAYPKRTDTSIQVLYSLGDIIKISPGETKTITVRYQNTTTKEYCNAISSLMIQPVATTDYLMNTKKDGTGTDITSYLTVSVTYRTAEAEISMTNASGYTGKVTFLRLRGYGVYQDSSIRAVVEDTASQASYSELELNIEQQYQRDTIAGEVWAEKIITRDASPRTQLDKISFIANNSDTAMQAFLSIDIGDMVKITEPTLNLDNYYFVNGIEFAITGRDLIAYSWILAEADPSLYGGDLSLIAVEFNEMDHSATGGNPAVSGIVTYGNIPELVDLPEQSITAWVNMNTAEVLGNIVCMWVDGAGGLEWSCGIRETAGLWLELIIPHSDGDLRWRSDLDAGVALNNWVCVGISIVWTDIKFYSRGNLRQTYIVLSPVGNRESAEGAHYTLGNIRSTDALSDFEKPFRGMLADVRHYNRVLTDAEFAQVNADGIGGYGVKNGMLFQGPCVLTKDLAYFTDHNISPTDRLIDNIRGHVGKAEIEANYTNDGEIITRILP